KTLKEGTAKMQDAWEKGGLKFTQKPQVLGVGHTFADVSVETLLDGKPGEVFTLLNETGLRDLKDPKKLSLQAIEALTYGAHIDVKDVVIYPQGRSPQAKAEYAGDPATYLKSMGLPATGANVYSRANEIAIGLKEKALTEAHLKLLNPDSKIRVSVEYFDAAKGALYSFDASKNRFVPSFKSEPGRPGARPKGPGADLK
ncbi:MAG: hypothetical protein PHE27_06555, partial [Alphaproteobacteria bacterium]|nr:hypothetical protein [Alphaproteobacteria bacterium]